MAARMLLYSNESEYLDKLGKLNAKTFCDYHTASGDGQCSPSQSAISDNKKRSRTDKSFLLQVPISAENVLRTSSASLK